MVTLIFAPWAFGSTEPWSIHVLEILCILTFISGALDGVLKREWRFRYPWLGVLLALCAGYVGFQLLNSLDIHVVRKWSVYELSGGSTHLPHTVHWESTVEWGVRWVCFLLVGMMIVCRVRSREEIAPFMKVVVVNAAIISVVGVLCHLSESDLLLGFRKPRFGGIIFGPYVNRNNFAAYVNLALPLALGFALLPDMLRRQELSKTPQRIFSSRV
jgi:hypothetical protein